MSSKAMTALAFLIAGLIGIVIVVGLAQKILDATGVVLALSTVLTGLVAGVAMRDRTKPPSGGDSE
ncbi:putative membrane protein [Nocardioides sp. BE266]|uniref:hypothetical protein n=1 Tax=Nocardioides sp. BE266 TaxID=2817725 RepID=UPI0028606E5D|nr:hypothetical protein [Nocardioides sp. BE266]MDR7253698.1 putative membrane protein [Nocardioides sp. BE266]